jgi:hypothetical protein
MAKSAISLTIDQSNLLWLKGRARVVSGGSLSEAVDQLIAEARAGRLGQGAAPRSVAGTIDLPDDAALASGRDALLGLFSVSLARPLFVHEESPPSRTSKPVSTKKKRRA